MTTKEFARVLIVAGAIIFTTGALSAIGRTVEEKVDDNHGRIIALETKVKHNTESIKEIKGAAFELLLLIAGGFIGTGGLVIYTGRRVQYVVQKNGNGNGIKQ